MGNMFDRVIELLNSMTDDEIVEAMSYKSDVDNRDELQLDAEIDYLDLDRRDKYEYRAKESL